MDEAAAWTHAASSTRATCNDGVGREKPIEPSSARPVAPSVPPHRSGDASVSLPPPPLTPARRLVYETLLRQRHQQWTIRGLVEALPAEANINVGAVRDIVNVLLAHRFVNQVPGQRGLTVVLSSRGAQALIEVLRGRH